MIVFNSKVVCNHLEPIFKLFKSMPLPLIILSSFWLLTVAVNSVETFSTYIRTEWKKDPTEAGGIEGGLIDSYVAGHFAKILSEEQG